MMRPGHLFALCLMGSAAGSLPVVTSKALAQPAPQPPAAYEPDMAYSGKLSYDPSTCSRDPQGMIFFALGRRVLRQPMDNLGYMMGLNAAERRVMPHTLHPEEPVGCPDHPVQMSAYDLRRVSPVPGDAPAAASADANRISLIINDGDIPNQQNDLFELMCRTHKLRDYGVPGFVGCKKAYPCDQGAAYQATEYAGPDGSTKVALECRASLDCTPRLAACSGGYLLREHFTVNFKFAVGALPIERFPAADQEVRRRLDAAEVRGFEWMPRTSDNSPEKMQ